MAPLNAHSRTSIRGFTMMELLVAIGIIGLLATVGIPIWKKQVMKAKKSEAKVGLSSIYAVEKGFFTEYGSYGSNLTVIGFQMEPQAKYYTFGFPTANCIGIDVKPVDDPITAPNSAVIKERHPDYYSAYTPDDAVQALPTLNNCAVGSVSDNGDSYLATASGALKPGKLEFPDLADMDLWRIDDFNQISNVQDGVH